MRSSSCGGRGREGGIRNPRLRQRRFIYPEPKGTSHSSLKKAQSKGKRHTRGMSEPYTRPYTR